ncbi:MAG: hypothetical protein KDC27_18880, partial [Acidobacteria bacterium]|nr:hypothetical protein [Acidobacteriota bacterium]
VESALRARFDAMVPAPSDASLPALPAIAPQPSRQWEVRLALAEVDHELGRYDRAEAALLALEMERPGDLRVEAALGALAMDRGRYDEAERRLLLAADSPSASARTHYRLALMLLRPAAHAPAEERGAAAVAQARLALDAVPRSPDYRLGLAQALMVAERWESAAAELRTLSSHPGWQTRARDEMAELIRRRQQALAAEQRPVLASEDVEAIPVAPLETAAVPPPPKPPPPKPMRWPPAGAAIMAGRIDYVDCSGPQKMIVMRHPVLDVRFREPKGRPAKLFASPLKDWKEIPCGAQGWTVNVAYRPRRASDGALGDALAILF